LYVNLVCRRDGERRVLTEELKLLVCGGEPFQEQVSKEP
jgi:hypothetical protein